jgi:hypothetical protein
MYVTHDNFRLHLGQIIAFAILIWLVIVAIAG